MKEGIPFENELNINNHENITTNEQDFQKLIGKLEKSGSILVETFKNINAEERNLLDSEVLNLGGLSWGAFNGIEKDKEEKVLELVNKFKSSNDQREKREIGKQLTDLIS